MTGVSYLLTSRMPNLVSNYGVSGPRPASTIRKYLIDDAACTSRRSQNNFTQALAANKKTE
jgi:hypothetical protein